MKKPIIFIANIKSTHNFLHFSQRFERDLEIFDNETTVFFQKMKKLLFLAVDSNKRRKENNLNSPNLSNIARGNLILKDCDIASYPCSNNGRSNLLF